MRGHIAKKGNRYYAVVYEGIDAATGKPRHRWHAAGETRKGAEKILGDLVKRMHDGDYRSPDKITLGDYLLERWLPSKRTRVKPSTASAYERNIRLHINPNIGLIPLQKLQPEDLDELYVKLLTEGKRNGTGGGLSAKSVRNVHATIQSALSDATRKGTVFRNVADIADPPSISRSGRSMNVWNGDQLRTFLEAIGDHELYPLYFLAATTGMRRGEIAGLRWRNVDLEAARLTVNQQVVSVEYELIEADLKTASSRRTIDLDEQTIAMLRRHRRHQLEDRMATGQRGDDGFVFAKPDGTPVHPDLISQTFQRFMTQSDLPTIRLHDLRHTHATILLQQNIHPKVVSERLGHSSIAFTMTVYQHVMPGMQAEAAATFGAAVFGE
ncbi:MAG: site-specific integrase [Hyphomicrobiales bacterium]|nr:site-specific integrase [Hyphomicrobiales bacterium]